MDSAWGERSAPIDDGSRPQSVVAQVLEDTHVAPADMPGPISEVRYMPAVQKGSADYSLTGCQDESNSGSISLVQLNSTYYVEEQLAGGQYFALSR